MYSGRLKSVKVFSFGLYSPTNDPVVLIIEVNRVACLVFVAMPIVCEPKPNLLALAHLSSSYCCIQVRTVSSVLRKHVLLVLYMVRVFALVGVTISITKCI